MDDVSADKAENAKKDRRCRTRRNRHDSSPTVRSAAGPPQVAGLVAIEPATRGLLDQSIRKAEAGETVRHDVLSTLAQTLSTADEAVSVPMLALTRWRRSGGSSRSADRHEIRMLTTCGTC